MFSINDQTLDAIGLLILAAGCSLTIYFAWCLITDRDGPRSEVSK